MYSKWLSLIATILTVLGTIKAVLSILKMRISDVIYERSAEGLDKQEFSKMQQVYDARVGIPLVILGAIIQILSLEIIIKISCFASLIITIFGVILSGLWWSYMRYLYNKERIKLSNK